MSNTAFGFLLLHHHQPPDHKVGAPTISLSNIPTHGKCIGSSCKSFPYRRYTSLVAPSEPVCLFERARFCRWSLEQMVGAPLLLFVRWSIARRTTWIELESVHPILVKQCLTSSLSSVACYRHDVSDGRVGEYSLDFVQGSRR